MTKMSGDMGELCGIPPTMGQRGSGCLGRLESKEGLPTER